MAELQTMRLVDNDGVETDFRTPRLIDVIERMRGRGITEKVTATDLK